MKIERLQKMVLASDNQGKLAEFGRLLSPLGFEVQSQGFYQVAPCDEPFETFVENALYKARHAAAATGLPALADDSGLCVAALNGAPGVYSARYAGNSGGAHLTKDQRNCAKLLADLNGASNRQAYFYCVLVFVRHAHDPQPIVVDGFWQGQVAEQLTGAGGFGYDACFFVPEHGLTAAQLSDEQKNLLSHRGQAARALIARLSAQKTG
jgi:XTP/dITP diphosphohydrolase